MKLWEDHGRSTCGHMYMESYVMLMLIITVTSAQIEKLAKKGKPNSKMVYVYQVLVYDFEFLFYQVYHFFVSNFIHFLKN